MATLERAISIAVEAHAGDTDKAGAPYILHPLRVMMACASNAAKIVGVLHDVVEDSEWTIERLRDEGFSPEVLAGIEAVTKRPDEKGTDDGYERFCRRAAEHPIGREVKRADLLDNLDVTRLEEVTESDRERLDRYLRALAIVSPSSDATPDARHSGSKAKRSARTRADTRLPALIVHADWGSNPRKRWMCVASLDDGDQYLIHAPEVVGGTEDLIRRLVARAQGDRVLVGFDFPIGIPRAYAELAGVDSFPDFLTNLGRGEWSRFYDVAEQAEEVQIHRPFYPMRPGGTKQAHLTEGLGVSSMRELLRECDRGSDTRGPASPIFWTMGGKQVGKAAIIGWREVLGPALLDDSLDVGLWPFDGPLNELVDRHDVTIVETYPAEACLHLGMKPPGRGWSKTSQEGRLAQRDAIEVWAQDRAVRISAPAKELVQTGFGSSKHAEDPFDAMIGLLSMIEVALGHRGDGAPEDPSVTTVEGWILGQRPAESVADGTPRDPGLSD